MKVSKFIATGFYSGYSPLAPGTAGTLAAMLMFFFLYSLSAQFFDLSAKIAVAAMVFVIALASSNSFLRSGIVGQSEKDPQVVVIDEFAGYAVTLLGVGGSWQELLLAFVFFRIFDVLKPPPARQAEALPGAFGIVMDDIIAGIYAALCCMFFGGFLLGPLV